MINNNKMKKITVFLLALMMAFVVTGCGGSSDTDNSTDSDDNAAVSQEKDDAAPDFEVELAGGGTFRLSEAAGKVTIINFWATWCPPCCEEMPAFEKLYNEYGEQINIVAVDYGESRDVVDAFISENGYTFPIAYDETGSVSSLYPSEGIPYTVIVDEEGVVAETFTGARDADTQYRIYKDAVEEAMND